MLRQPRRLALLVYLALAHPKGLHQRDKLLALFWPEMDTTRADGQAQVSAAESETRRLKARLSEVEATLEATRRAAREGRSVEDMRVRLLLDTVLDAAQGLRRELALPPEIGRAHV